MKTIETTMFHADLAVIAVNGVRKASIQPRQNGMYVVQPHSGNKFFEFATMAEAITFAEVKFKKGR